MSKCLCFPKCLYFSKCLLFYKCLLFTNAYKINLSLRGEKLLEEGLYFLNMLIYWSSFDWMSLHISFIYHLERVILELSCDMIFSVLPKQLRQKDRACMWSHGSGGRQRRVHMVFTRYSKTYKRHMKNPAKMAPKIHTKTKILSPNIPISKLQNAYNKYFHTSSTWWTEHHPWVPTNSVWYLLVGLYILLLFSVTLYLYNVHIRLYSFV